MVQTFEELEERFESVSVVSGDPSKAISGRLVLDGDNTLADLESDYFFDQNTTEEGWFSVHLKQRGASQILLKNALMVSATDSLFGRGHWRYSIFPNIVILDSQHLASDETVRQVSFRLRHLDYFFWYGSVEHHFLDEHQDAFLELLQTLRRDGASKTPYSKSPADYEFNRPTEIHVLHELPEPLEFRVGNKKYSIFLSRLTTMGIFNSARVKHEPVATITFDDPVGIENALDAVRSWHRFFNQVALEDLSLVGLSAAGSPDPKGYSASLYLPNQAKDGREPSDGRALSPGDVPFNHWDEREVLKSVMESWMKNEVRFQRFRTLIDYVIQNQKRGNWFDHLTTLCAAIDSIPELGQGHKGFDKLKLNEMAQAAHNTAKSKEVPIPLARIKGALGQIGSPTLKDRIFELINSTNNAITDSQKQALAKQTLRLRAIAAHGRPSESLKQPVLVPVCHALLALCILYDLQLSGLFTRETEGSVRSKAKHMLATSMQSLS